MAQAVENTFARDNNFKCFGCAPHNLNPDSLDLKIFYDTKSEETVVHSHLQNRNWESFPGVIHGGILSTIIDDVAYWTTCLKFRSFALTTKLEVSYNSPVYVSDKIEIRGKIIEHTGKRVKVEVNIWKEKTQDNERQLCTTGHVYFALTNLNFMKKLIPNSSNSLTMYEDQMKGWNIKSSL
eukprot:TRINITY_DN10381_c0_g1_i3.p1 TRINITY_DN10381_c0_g1~~TRINITY_DN10381_c0_g1_i3.p1  ORF type:complete len:181 (+),score=18.92 TRINITY_DN10381_c0_g1_i3:63-605(+)